MQQQQQQKFLSAPVLLQLIPTIVNPFLIATLLRDDPAAAFTNAFLATVIGLLTLLSVQCTVAGECTRLAWFYTSISLITTGFLVYALRAKSMGVDVSKQLRTIYASWTGGKSAAEEKEIQFDKSK
jgi:hypothetical protein